MPVIDRSAVPEIVGTRYPAPYDVPCRERRVRRLGEAGGLTHFGVSEVVLPPGSWSSQRHWHTAEDEFVWVVEGEVVLVTDAGETVMRAGECAAFKAGVRDGHCVHNRTTMPARLLAAGNRSDDDHAEYPDLDLVTTPGRYSGRGGFRHRDGTPY